MKKTLWKSKDEKQFVHLATWHGHYTIAEKDEFCQSIITPPIALISLLWLKRICYSHWTNGDQNGVISIGQWGMFNQSHLATQKEGVVTTIIFSNHKTY